MKEQSRSRNAKKNIFFGYIAQIGICILSFVGRRVFLKFLTTDYLGINGLYTNILSILSLAELGLDAAVVYSLYKPVADDDKILIHSLLNFFKKLYLLLALIILAIGIILIPFLKYLIDSNISNTDLIVYYLLFLTNTMASYFVAYKVALLSASQEQRIQKIVTLVFNLILQLVYIVVLYVFRNYYAYIGATVVSTILTNITLSKITEKLHPEVFKETRVVAFDKKPIIERMKSTMLYKIGVVLINSTDNILISVLVSTIAVGLYSNYYTVISALTSFVAIITTSLIASVGNLAVKDNKEKQKELFNMMVLFYHFIAALGLIGFSLLFNNLIVLWLGNAYLFDKATVFIIALNFYLSNAISPVWMFREANGLFNEVKYLILIRAAINILLSVLLGIKYGVFGIFLATAISLLVTNFWYEPRILFKSIFNTQTSYYWMRQIKYCAITALSYILCFLMVNRIEDTFGLFIIKTLIICSITGIVFFVSNISSKEFESIKKYVFKS